MYFEELLCRQGQDLGVSQRLNLARASLTAERKSLHIANSPSTGP